ncbi:hypothetical protein MYK68_18555 [Gordonia sp. PP30]|uniref:hypothetical protein n=1 Tax=Gordonia sp. PP30 TaxID=2935861 RepID=UPI001FFF7F34|nr:hypothetical protein [Gordonia sp. PP30]UQE74686.1 hypothetical protein MYK68_18555 [Gordonia sp. PP30]
MYEFDSFSVRTAVADIPAIEAELVRIGYDASTTQVDVEEDVADGVVAIDIECFRGVRVADVMPKLRDGLAAVGYEIVDPASR